MQDIAYRSWYETLEKPFFAPPAEVFGVAWGIIYPLMFIALLVALYGYFRTRTVSKDTLVVFAGNLFLNVLFSPVQLALKNNVLSSLMILGVLGTLVYLQYRLWQESKAAFWLLVPYLLWGSFATVLQLALTVLNI